MSNIMDHGLVSIVLPTFNCAHFLPRAIQSILCQTYQHWELLVIDNHSTDNTTEVIEAFQDKRIRLLQTHNEGIIAKSRNLGIHEAAGCWVAFLDADDWWTEDKLEVSVQALGLGYDLVYHDMVRKGPGKRIFHGHLVRTWKLSSPVFTDLLLNGNGIINSSVVVSTHLLLEVGGLSENPLLVAVEDYDCWLRIAKKTEKFFRLQKPYGFYWIGHSNVHIMTNVLRYLNELCYLYFPGSSLTESTDLPPWLVFSAIKAYIKETQYEKAFGLLSNIAPLELSRRYFIQFLALKLLVYVRYKGFKIGLK